MLDQQNDSSEEDTEFDLPSELSTEENQEARAFLRERFLRAVTGIVGKECQIYMFDNTKVTAEFRGSDANITRFCVQQLKTPLGVLPEAIIRTSDIIKIHIPNIDGLRT